MNLNRVVKFHRRTTTQDDHGQQQEGLRLLGQSYASVRPIGSREYYAASGERAKITHEVTIRYFPDLRHADVITLEDREFDIESVINLNEQDRFYKLRVSENGS